MTINETIVKSILAPNECPGSRNRGHTRSELMALTLISSDQRVAVQQCVTFTPGAGTTRVTCVCGATEPDTRRRVVYSGMLNE